MDILKKITFAQALVLACLFFVFAFQDWTAVAALTLVVSLIALDKLCLNKELKELLDTLCKDITRLEKESAKSASAQQSIERLAEETKSLLSQTKMQNAFGRK